MNHTDWYTDRMDVYRTVQEEENHLTVSVRKLVYENVPCRLYRSYRSDHKALELTDTAAQQVQENQLMAGLEVVIEAGDELLIYRGKALGREEPVLRAFAARPNCYYEPFGAVMPALAHQEIRLYSLTFS